MNLKIKYFAAIFVLLGFFLTLTTWAANPIDPNFDPGLLIPDNAFSDTGTFGSAAGIQTFLESKNSILARTDQAFLIKLKEPTNSKLKNRLEDPQPSLNRLRTAAELIYDASISVGLNPQVILVTLQKEQSLITGHHNSDEQKLQRALDRSLGYGCPDNQPCQATFLSFYNQLFGTVDANNDRWIGAARSLMRSFNHQVNGVRVGRGPLVDANNNAHSNGGPFVRMSRQGDTIVLSNTLGGYFGVEAFQTVELKNFATTALYRYTPHVFNGNYNFWRFYREWFLYPNGTVIKLQNDPTLWVIENGSRRAFSSFVATQRGIKINPIIIVSSTELNRYEAGTRLTPLDGTLIRSEGDNIIYLMENGQRRPISQFAANQRQLNLNQVVNLPKNEVESYELGVILTPNEGTLIKATSNPTVYVIHENQKRPLTLSIFNQRQYRFSDVATLGDQEVELIPSGDYMPPLNNSLVKSPSSPAVYLTENNTKRIISGPIFNQRGFRFDQVFQLSEQEMARLPEGAPLPPQESSLIKKADDPTIYFIRNKTKVPLTFGVFMQKELFRQSILTLSENELQSLPTYDYALSPQDGTYLKAPEEAAIYLVENGRLRLLTFEAYVNRNLTPSMIQTFPSAEINVFEKGAILAN